MIVVILCCNMICGCLDVDNRHIQCPQNFDGYTVQVVDYCRKGRGGLECECVDKRINNQ